MSFGSPSVSSGGSYAMTLKHTGISSMMVGGCCSMKTESMRGGALPRYLLSVNTTEKRAVSVRFRLSKSTAVSAIVVSPVKRAGGENA